MNQFQEKGTMGRKSLVLPDHVMAELSELKRLADLRYPQMVTYVDRKYNITVSREWLRQNLDQK